MLKNANGTIALPVVQLALPNEFQLERLAYSAQFAIDPNSMPTSIMTGSVTQFSGINEAYIGGIIDPKTKKALYPETHKKLISTLFQALMSR